MIDAKNVFLGKNKPLIDGRALRLADYLDPQLTAPATCDNTKGVTDWGMLANDRLGCCTISAVAHLIQTWRLSLDGRLLVVPDEDVVEYYERWDGYVDGDPVTDQGGAELDVLKKWRSSTFTISGVGHNLKAFVNPAPKNRGHLKLGIYLFGAIYLGLALPMSAQSQKVWDVDTSWAGFPGTWGGHAVSVAAYDEKEVLIQTWGQNQRATWEFIDTYCDEAHILMSDTDWGNMPEGIDYVNLQNDLNLLV